jgi:hypothetical protein
LHAHAHVAVELSVLANKLTYLYKKYITIVLSSVDIPVKSSETETRDGMYTNRYNSN